MAKKKTSSMVWVRRFSQTVFLLLFLYLFMLTVYHPDNETYGPVKLFFDFDPLVMLSVWLGGHFVSALLLSLITIVFTIILGRWFCGWICPFGTVHNMFRGIQIAEGEDKIKAGSYSVWQKSKYYILTLALVCAFFGANLAGWLDPISFLFRSLAVAVFPLVNAGFQGFFDWMYKVDPVKLSVVTEPVYGVFRRYFLAFSQPHYFWGMLLGILFGVAIALNLFRNRFWCRYICPLGAMLGIFGKNPTLRLKVDTGKCTDCSLCAMDCPTGADPVKEESWRASECIYCWNCESSCPVGAITFKFQVPLGDKSLKKSILRWNTNFFKPPWKKELDLGRRRLLTAGIVGLSGGMLFKANPLSGERSYNPELIRPPGSVSEDEFLERCVRCGECMKVCPTNVIQPCMLEGGLEGLWTPVLKTGFSYCEYKCSMCTEVCPSEAIRPLSLKEKQEIKIGLAEINPKSCLPYAYSRACQVCYEQCPLPEKAIWLEEAVVPDYRGNQVPVKYPHVNADLCIGCGICQNKCPVSNKDAIKVTSIGETRHFKNQFLAADRYSG